MNTSNTNWPKPAAIFFDWDGTLVDSYSLLEAAHEHVLQSLNKAPLGQGGFKGYFGMAREEIYPALYGHDQAAEAQKRFEDFITKNHKTMLPPIDGAKELLDTAHNLGIALGVVSNKKPEFVNAEIDHFNWRYLFTSTVGSKEAQNDKPSADPLFLGVQRSNIEAKMNQIWYVGDTKTDFLCAKEAQSPFIYVDTDNKMNEWGETQNPTLHAKNLNDIIGFLLQYAEKPIQKSFEG